MQCKKATRLICVNSVKVSDIITIEIDPYYEIILGIEYFLLREEKYYDSQKNYFRIRMNSEFSSITLRETKTKSLFAVKNEYERDPTMELVGEWLIKTNAFKEVINELIQKRKWKTFKQRKTFK